MQSQDTSPRCTLGSSPTDSAEQQALEAMRQSIFTERKAAGHKRSLCSLVEEIEEELTNSRVIEATNLVELMESFNGEG
jgi:hypothetical protein